MNVLRFIAGAQKSILLLVFCISLSGCAVTGLGKDERVEITLTKYRSSDENDISVYLSCSSGEKAYSFMISPVIPLPPIIPLPDAIPFLNLGEAQVLQITYLNKYTVNSVIIVGALDKRRISISKEHTPSASDTERSSTLKYNVNSSCESLDSHELFVEYENRITKEKYTEIYKIKYIDGDLRIFWGYIGA